MERLQRVLAAAGVASRRRAEELIVEGRVRVDGQIITELGTRVDPETQKIEVDGNLIPSPRKRYIILNKPSGYITTTSDERNRYTVMDLVHVNERVVPVGRLDRQTEGLLLLTNDGEVANRVMHPRYEIDKEYEALLDGFPPPEVLERLRRGIVIDGQRAKPEMVRPLRNTDDGTIVRIVIHEGRNRIVRKMFDEVGYPVIKLVRTRVGPLQLGAIPRGTFRDLTDGELRALREALRLTDEDVEFADRTADRPLRDRPDPARLKTGRPRQSNEERQGRGPQRPRRDGQRPSRPRRDEAYAGPAQARGGDERDAGRPARTRRPEDRRPRRPDDRDERRFERSSGPPRGRARPAAGPQRGPGGPKRGSGGPPRGGVQRGPGPRNRRDDVTRGAGGGGDRPPDNDNDRRPSGGGEEHRRRDRRQDD